VTKPVHPFTQHHARFSRAVANLPTAHDQAKEAAVGHIHAHVTDAAKRAGMDTDDVGTFWYQDRPHVSVRPGTKAEKLEYGTLNQAPNATVRNAARSANQSAVKMYHTTMRRGLGI
jgi:hypothetical protein